MAYVVLWSVLALYYGLMHFVHAFRRYNIMSGSKQSVKFFNQHGSLILIKILKTDRSVDLLSLTSNKLFY